MNAKVPPARLVIPPAVSFIVFGVCFTSLAVGIAIFRGDPKLLPWACWGFGIGGLVGYLVGIKLFEPKEPLPLPRPPFMEVKPVEIVWRDGDGGPLQLGKLKTVSNLELLRIAEKVVPNHFRITFNSCGAVIGQQRFSDFQDELTKPGPRRLAYWRSSDSVTGDPYRKQGIVLTERGKRLLTEHIRQSPTPEQRRRLYA